MSHPRARALTTDAAREEAEAAPLARAASRRDKRAFERIFKKYHQEIYRYCLSIVRRREDAEDALQGTMAAALRSLPGEKREIALRPWLYRVAHNESISLLRQRRPSAELDESTDPIIESAYEEAESKDRLRTLVSDLRSLPDRQSSALVMRELNGLDYDEIGAALTCSGAAARQTVYEARTALRKLEEGREMECAEVRRAISDRDGRRLRGRKIKAHLGACDGCNGFAASIELRKADLRALCPPIPAMAAAAMASGLVGGGGAGGLAAGGAAGGAGGAGGAATLGGLAGAGFGGTAALKGASVLAGAVIAAGAADATGVVDLPLPGGDRSTRTDDGAGGGAGNSTLQKDDGAGATSTGTGTGAGTAPARDVASGNSSGGNGRSEDAPGQTGASPGKSEEAPGHGGSSPGNSESAPGHSGAGPGKSESAPGHSGSSPGKSEDAPGHGGSSPGNSGSAPGQSSSSASPGNSGSAPGAGGGSSASAGNSGSAPGHSGSSAGNSGSAAPTGPPSSSGSVPESSGPAPGQSGSAGNSASAPGRIK